MIKDKCKECDKQAKCGHNYCRVCGYHLTKGFIQFIRIAIEYSTIEKYCGYCGKEREECKC